jgi:hypothetical protein
VGLEEREKSAVELDVNLRQRAHKSPHVFVLLQEMQVLQSVHARMDDLARSENLRGIAALDAVV